MWAEAVQVVSCAEEAADRGSAGRTWPSLSHRAVQPGMKFHPLCEGVWLHFSHTVSWAEDSPATLLYYAMSTLRVGL